MSHISQRPATSSRAVLRDIISYYFTSSLHNQPLILALVPSVGRLCSHRDFRGRKCASAGRCGGSLALKWSNHKPTLLGTEPSRPAAQTEASVYEQLHPGLLVNLHPPSSLEMGSSRSSPGTAVPCEGGGTGTEVPAGAGKGQGGRQLHLCPCQLKSPWMQLAHNSLRLLRHLCSTNCFSAVILTMA